MRGEAWLPLGLGGIALELPGILLSMIAARDAGPVLATTAPLVTVAAETWVATSDGATYASATGAFQAARVSTDPSAFAVSATDLDSAVVLVGV